MNGNPSSSSTFGRPTIEYLLMMREVEDLLYLEADLLDQREFEQWLELFTEDLRYWMPIRKNMPFKDRHRDITGPDDVAWFDDDKETLSKRVKQILTGIHWAEEPLSRVSHLVSNIRLVNDFVALAEGGEAKISSHFLLHRNRLETETDWIAGRREDVVRRIDQQLRICKRTIIIDQSVLLAKNLTMFF